MQLSGLRSRIQQRKAGGTGASVSLSDQISQDKVIKSKVANQVYKDAHNGLSPQEHARKVVYFKELFRLEDADSEFNRLRNMIPVYQTFAAGNSDYRRALPLAVARVNELNMLHKQKARAYADSKSPSSGLSGLSEMHLADLGTYGGGQTITTSSASICESMGGTVLGIDTSTAHSLYSTPGYGPVAYSGVLCYLPPPPPPRAAPAPAANVRVNVSPTVQTQISPQISPAFQQAFQPTGSPMTAGTSQNMPTTQAAAPPVPTYQPPPAPAPTAAPDQSAALLASQQKMIDLLQSQLQAPKPSVQPLPAPAAAAPIAPPMPQQYAAPLPIQSAAPLPAYQTAPVSVDTGLPQYGLSTAGQTAAAAFSAQAAPSAPPTVSTVQPAAPKSNMPMILAILAGAGILFVSMNQKGKRHATR